MKLKQMVPLVAVILVAGTIAGGSLAAAGSTKTPVDVYEITCVGQAGVEWTQGNASHIRGEVNNNIFYDTGTFEVVGGDTVIANANFNLITGQARYWGTFSGIYLPVSDTGTFDGAWNGAIGSDGAFLGRAVGKGTGDLKGSKIVLTLRSVDLADVPPELWVILSQPPWTECAEIGGIFRDTGYIYWRHPN